ncbi:hypothetical protein [Kosakonia phage Kc283]|uniref:Uncharacterized protein n=1 Tax=Kosakonia phage Kc283 TaxID=2863195 RepID=A0AAE8BE90_9CAUD|nr:hypothetical protein PP755_gp03 [Kosakonia phage Kc283]QYN79805.1 hypothetical protein [Kosakonia phage Kc283]
MSIQCLIYTRPFGNRTNTEINAIDEDDESYFKEKGVKLSMESDGRGNYILYADIGKVLEDGTPQDIIHITKAGETCNQAMHALRELVEADYAKAEMP